MNTTDLGLIGYRNPKKYQGVMTPEEAKERKESAKAEFNLRKKLCSWMNDTYPGLLFIVDYAADMPTSGYIASLINQQSCIDKMLDLTILEPHGGYFGLIIEIKTDKGNVFLKDGTLSQAKHTLSQHKTVERLCKYGYLSLFGVGRDNLEKIINYYLSLPLTIPVKVFDKHNVKVF